MTTAAPSTTLATIQPAFTDAEWLALAASRIGPCIVTTVAERSAARKAGTAWRVAFAKSTRPVSAASRAEAPASRASE